VADIFSVTPGAVVAVASSGIPLGMYLEGWYGYPVFKSIITGFQVTSQSGVQFLHTLRDFIYVYSFGERIGSLTISGISFAYQCETGNVAYHGIDYVSAYYLRSRASSYPRPVIAVLGGATPFAGFLTGMRLGITDTERIVGEFSYEFKVVPSLSTLDVFFG
jgi:hypothetical protein